VAGGKLFLLNVAKALAPEYQLTLLSLCANEEEMEDKPSDGVFAEAHKVFLSKWRSVWNVIGALPTRTPLQLAYYRSGEFRAKLRGLMPRHDVVLAHLIRTGQYFEETGSTLPSALLMADAISLAYQRMAKLPGSSALWHWLYRAELKRLAAYERSSPKNFDQTWLHSDIDRGFLGLDGKSTRIVPIGVDLEEFPFRPPDSGNVVVFIGNMSFSLNLDACRHFIRNIFPSLRAKRDIRFRVVGACPPSVKRDLELHPGVEVTGRVARIAEAVSDAFCGVCPIRAGAGIQNKVLNYLALGIPCVTSRVGLEGLNAVDGTDLLVYDEPSDAVTHILNLHANGPLRRTLVENGRRFVEREHDWRAIHQLVRRNVAELANSPDE
jgi:glycosyltransferase involved in cell wall biosynthesis